MLEECCKGHNITIGLEIKRRIEVFFKNIVSL
jgi:hypothetical protein